MTVRVVGDVDERLVQSLRRRLSVDVQHGWPGGTDEYACVVAGAGDLDRAAGDNRVSLIVLVEPTLDMRDASVRTLAGINRPVLEIVDHVAADIQAERTWALLQSLVLDAGRHERRLRELEVESSHLVEGAPVAGSWAGGADPDLLAGQTIGYIGFGPLAWSLAQRARSAGVEMLAWQQHDDRASRIESEGVALRTGTRLTTFGDVLSESDIVVLDLQYGPDSIRIIDAPELALMRRDALLVNTSNGRAIDEGALLQALRSGHLAGAALDRFNYEPLPSDSPLRQIDRLLLTPGIAIPDEVAVLDETARRVALAIVKWMPEARTRRVLRLSRGRPEAR